MATAEKLVQEWTPGWYEGLSLAEYLAIPAMSASGIVAANRSPAHFKEERDNPRPATPDMKEGSALHCALLEAHLFARQYLVLGPCEAELKSGARKGEECGSSGKVLRDGRSFCGKHDPADGEPMEVETITEEQHARIVGMRDAILAHSDARRFFIGEGRSEVTGIWRDAKTGLLCKLRLDRDIGRAAIHADVKTCRSAHASAFRRHAVQMGYPLKCAWYRRGMKELGRPAIGSVLIAAEKKRPHGVQLFLVSEANIGALQGVIDRNLLRIAECERTGVWPGYDSGMRELEMKPWEIEETGADAHDDGDDWEGFDGNE